MTLTLLDIKAKTEVRLFTPGDLPEQIHVFDPVDDPDPIRAINAALAARRPPRPVKPTPMTSLEFLIFPLGLFHRFRF